MFCANCGNKIPENAQFCPNCGAHIKDKNRSQISEANIEDTVRDPEVKQEDAPENSIKSDKTGNNKIRPRVWIVFIIILVCVFIVGIIIGINIGGRDGSDISVSEEWNESPVEEESAEDTEIAAQEKGVTRAKEMDPEYSTPEDYVAYVYENYLISDINAEGLWDDQVSSASKGLEIEDKDKYVDDMANDVNLYGLQYLSYEPQGAKEVEDGIYMVNGSVKYIQSEVQSTEDLPEFVVIEDGQYKLLLSGATEKITYVADSDNGNLYASSVDLIYCVDGTVNMNCVLENHSSSDISLGWVDGSQVELLMENGESRYDELGSHVVINAGESTTLSLTFDNIDADITKMIIHSVNVLNSQGLPENVWEGADYTFTFNESNG